MPRSRLAGQQTRQRWPPHAAWRAAAGPGLSRTAGALGERIDRESVPLFPATGE
jgi:hypothetical protein